MRRGLKITPFLLQRIMIHWSNNETTFNEVSFTPGPVHWSKTYFIDTRNSFMFMMTNDCTNIITHGSFRSKSGLGNPNWLWPYNWARLYWHTEHLRGWKHLHNNITINPTRSEWAKLSSLLVIYTRKYSLWKHGLAKCNRMSYNV